MHDPRIGRFFARDPLFKAYPYYSPYVFSGNRVIDMVEVEGLGPADYSFSDDPLNFNTLDVNFKDFNNRTDYIIDSVRGVVKICFENGFTVNGVKILKK